ncbi:MAG: 3-methylcrotonyl-CoA carboxylase, partial [Luteitalea sp.]|nr:3-methylcrotonyl-CoA carboxylase [Luteitalea sp.]
TRLQVEHPVTELVAGVDLVHAQILVASGGPLPWRQSDLSQRGHAIEARVYAEDPANGFLPQAGRLLLYREPPGVRIDAGVVEGSEVPVQYDPMLAKVIALGETRDQAIARLEAALRAYPILGIRTNIPFLLRVLGDPRFRTGEVHTGFLDEEGASLAQAPANAPPPFVVAAVATADTQDDAQTDGGPGGAGQLAGQAPARHVPSAGRTPEAWDPWSRLARWRS